MHTIITTLLEILHIGVCAFLMLVVLLQQGKGGGSMGAAFGGGATQQVFGGRGAGNILTRATAVCAALFMITSISLAYVATLKDRGLRERQDQQREELRKGKGNEGIKVPTPPAAAPPAAPPAAPTGSTP